MTFLLNTEVEMPKGSWMNKAKPQDRSQERRDGFRSPEDMVLGETGGREKRTRARAWSTVGGLQERRS